MKTARRGADDAANAVTRSSAAWYKQFKCCVANPFTLPYTNGCETSVRLQPTPANISGDARTISVAAQTHNCA